MSPLRSGRVPLVDLLVDTQSELWELAVRAGLQVLEAMMEEDRAAVCGPRYAHDPDRARATRGDGGERGRVGRAEGWRAAATGAG